MLRKPLLLLTLLPALAVGAAPSADPRFDALDARIAALEANAQELRDQAAAAQAEAAAARAELQQMRAEQSQSKVAAVAAPAPAMSASNANGNAFNPAISMILTGQYAHHSLDPENYQRSGFPLVGEGGPGEQGLKLGESEISLSANIDDKFYGQITLAVGSEDGEDHLGVEEAFVDATALPAGLLALRAASAAAS